jgi:hypothetical protein
MTEGRVGASFGIDIVLSGFMVIANAWIMIVDQPGRAGMVLSTVGVAVFSCALGWRLAVRRRT